MRLVEGESRIRVADPQSARERRLWRHGHRRQPRRAHVVADAAAGRRQRAGAPGRRPRRSAGTCRLANARPANSKVTHKAVRPHVSNTARSRAMPPKIKLAQGAGDPHARSVQADRQIRCRGSTRRSRSTARPSSPSTPGFPAWSMPRSPPVRCPAASSKASTRRRSRPARRRASGQARRCGGGGRRPLLARQAKRWPLLKPEWDEGEAGKTDSAQFAKLYRDTLEGPMVTRAQRRRCR